jgi:hypothetical protein
MRIKDASTKSPGAHLASFHNKEWKEMEKEEKKLGLVGYTAH